ncbi:hypothetical protein K2173_007360 [Erythroxylum novogranatense]|uniref:tRNA pseudouridine(55) synthase n=1 Tax=Erythroxylum novogranatense TaxID=1862640 RepID=A0AAV8T7C8_9ROSI|nr:hypothetical protein K2173_007360 [Erythroxylum novogranatense]
MSSEIETTFATDVYGTAAAVESGASYDDEEIKVLKDAVRALPPHAVNDLLSKGVCVRCIFRLFGICGEAYLRSLPPADMIRIVRESTNADSHVEDSGLKADEHSSCLSTPKGSEVEPDVCSLCLGILQFHYRNDKGTLVKKLSPLELAIAITELVKQEGHQIDSFSLEISLPPLIQENEHAVWLYLKRKFGPENKFQKRLPEQISVKDALKFALATSLETLLGVKSGPTSYRIRLTYTENATSSISSDVAERNGGSKRRKTGSDLSSELLEVTRECIDNHKCEGDNILERDLTDLEDSDESFECFNLPTEKIKEPCCLMFLCYRTPIYFGGRYFKFSRNVSQTRWIIEDERMGEASVEEIIGGSILPACQGDNYKFHAAGREDIDVRMLGSGRPFLVEIQNARQIPSEALVKEVETKINNLENKLVGVKNLKVVGNQGWSLMHEGEAEKQKQYCALVWISRPLEDKDLLSIASRKDMHVLQRTPIRVLHRRSPLDRPKIIHWMKIERIAGSSQYFLLHLCTQAGTYIKEFVHGDLGRTCPRYAKSILSNSFCLNLIKFLLSSQHWVNSGLQGRDTPTRCNGCEDGLFHDLVNHSIVDAYSLLHKLIFSMDEIKA